MPARIALLALLGCLAGFAEVRVWQSTISLPTYREGPPDENPPYPLFQTSGQWQYPYTSRRAFTTRREVVTWRTIEIENEYLKCTVLPDLGGRLYNCVDKVSRRDLFYANPVIKKSDVAVRGAWAAAGTEFNFPIGHARHTVSPVDYAMKKNADGSAAVLVGATDRADGLRWLVETGLRPGSSVVEQHVTLSNPSPVRRRYYWWNNASVQAYEDTHFYLPCYLTTAHGGADVEPWPVNSKRVDMSALANHKSGGFARFAAGCREGFLGVYSKTDAGGTAHYADVEKVPGKKVWSWGTDQSGREASKNYTDDGSQYVEIQAGLFEDQETYKYLNPHEQRQFDEYWIPVRAIGGISRVNTEAALYMERAGAELRLTVNTYRAMPGAVLRVFEGDRVVSEEKAELEPGVIWKRSVSNAQLGAVYRFELSDAEGRVLLRHTEGLYDALRTGSQAPSKPDTALQEAERAEAEGNLLEAARKYDELLGRDANQPALQLAAGRVALELNRVASAHEHLMKAAISGELRFYRGIDYAYAGDEVHANEDLTAAAEDGVFGPAARLELAKLLARSGDREGALREVQTAVRSGANPAGAGDLEVVLLHSLGRTDQAMNRLGDWLGRDPADSLLLLEQTLLAGKDLSENDDLLRHLAADPERVLDLVTFYMQTGVYATALDLLSRKYPEVSSLESEPGAVLPQNYPLVAYYRGYCRMKMGASPDQDFSLAAKQRALYVFPNRVESFAILEEAIRRNSADANAEYLLGSLYLAAGLTDPAVAAWREAVKLHGEAPALHATLGRLLQQRKEDAAALEVLSEGNRIDPANKAVQDALIKSLEQKREELAKQTKPNFFADRDAPPPATPEEFATLALNMLLAGRIADAGALFNQRNFPKDRQSLLVREAFIETRLRTLLDAAEKKKCPQALAAVEAIGDESGDVPFSLYGFGNILKMPRIQYELGVAEATCGEEKAARKRWSKLVKVGEKGSGVDFAYSVLAAIRMGGKAPAGGATLPAGLTPVEQAYVQGMLEMAAGSKDAAVSFQKGVKEAAQDPMLRYLCQRGLLGM